MIETILPPITILCSIVVVASYLVTAKRCSPITKQDATFLWKLHKRRTACTSHHWHPITQKNTDKIIGFKCECGYRHTEKRPLLRQAGENTRTSMIAATSHAQPSKIRARSAV